jgi:Leucine-rich repeat (LRR) protein
LIILDVAGNGLTTLPLGIGYMGSLRTIYAAENQLTDLPASISKLDLYMLDLSDNQFTHLPTVISEIPNLQLLYVDKNP